MFSIFVSQMMIKYISQDSAKYLIQKRIVAYRNHIPMLPILESCSNRNVNILSRT